MRWMMNVLLLSFFLLGPTSAQSPHPNPTQRQDAIQQLYWESLSNAALRSQIHAARDGTTHGGAASRAAILAEGRQVYSGLDGTCPRVQPERWFQCEEGERSIEGISRSGEIGW